MKLQRGTSSGDLCLSFFWLKHDSTFFLWLQFRQPRSIPMMLSALTLARAHLPIAHLTRAEIKLLVNLSSPLCVSRIQRWRVGKILDAGIRRVGKIPKFLSHHLFSSARYSIWLDSKLCLQTNPYLILEYFLWHRGHEYAISDHYDRHCVWEEVMQNKKLNKYNHAVIDRQFEFYRSDGLKRFNPSDPNRLLPRYVLEGMFIVRAHPPMLNLFSCLLYNEVDRFTPRDQLSFAYTYLSSATQASNASKLRQCEQASVMAT